VKKLMFFMALTFWACQADRESLDAGQDAVSQEFDATGVDGGQEDLIDGGDSGLLDLNPGEQDGAADGDAQLADGGDAGADIPHYPCANGVTPAENILTKYQMLIVTGPQLVEEFRALADWKAQKGVPTVIVDTVTIDKNISGQDLPAKIREYIRQSWLQGVEWVLLGGDAEVVPPRLVHTRALTQFDETFASDFYYSDLDGTWDKNGNGVYGELADDCDMHPDIAVGRLPVSNAADVRAVTDKILLYEQTDNSKTLKALFISEDTGFLNFDSALQLNPLADNVFPARFEKQKLYWKYEGYPGATENSLAAQVAALEDGKNFVTHYGHASELDLNMEMNASDVDKLTNSPYFPIYVTCGCMAGHFDYQSADSAGERLLTNPSGGAVAYLGNTNYGLGAGGGTAFIEAFYKALFAGNTQLGNAMKIARETFYTNESSLQSELLGIRWTQFVVVLFGDPEMPARLDNPGRLVLRHPDKMRVGEQCLELEVTRESRPLAGATVTLYRRGQFLFRQQTDQQGRTVFRFDPGAPGSVEVTASNGQDLPALSVLEVF